MGPRYPLTPSQPNAGRLPSLKQMGPPDLRPTSMTAPAFQNRLDRAHGRFLAGLGSDNMEPEYAWNELNVMAEMDDVQGDGIFDPPNAQMNVHPGAGSFAANYSLPGMHAREKPFGFSEERDVTTGRPIRAVPSGAVANDSAAQIAYFERGLYNRPRPQMSLTSKQTPQKSTVNVMQNPIPVGQTPNNGTRTWGPIALIGAGVLGLYLMARQEARGT